MHTASWQEKPPAPWLYPPDLLPRIRFRLDLSSQRLSYQKQPLKSLELLYYDGAVQTEENIVSKRFITAKLTTTDKEYYSPQTDKMEQDNSHNVRKKASPFLSGTQIEKVTTEQGESRLDEDDSFWLNEGSDWRRSEEREDYAQRIHPAAAHYALSIVEHLARQGKKEIMILDIAGGNGDLGERIIKDIQKQFPELRIAYRLLDGNKKDVGTANRRFRIFNPEQVTASAFHRDIVRLSL